MHEVSICQSILEILEAELEENQFKNVREVHVKIGELSCVDPKILSRAFDYVIKGGPFEKSSLHTAFIKVLAGCGHCMQNFKVKDYRFVCPECDKPSSTIIEGNELTIYKIIFEEQSYAQVNQ